MIERLRIAEAFRIAQHADKRGFQEWSKRLEEHGG